MSMEDQTYSIQQQASATNLGQAAYHPVQGMTGYPSTGGHPLHHLQYLPHTHPAFPNQLTTTNQNIRDYAVPSGQPTQPNYHQSTSTHYATQIHGYHQADPYAQQQLVGYDNDHQNQLGHLSPYYTTSGGVAIGPESATQGANVTASLQNATGYSQYAQQLQAQQHYQQNLNLDPSGQAAGYGQFHQHPHVIPNFQQAGVQPSLDQTSYMAFGAAGQNPSAGFNSAYNPFGSTVSSVQNGSLAHYGILPQAGNQIGILDTSNLTGTRPQPQIGKSNIKNEEHLMENVIRNVEDKMSQF